MDMKKIGSFLKALRKEKGLTQEQLAEKLGVAGRTVSRWETASNMPDLSVLIQLAEFYDIEVGEILDGERKDKVMDKEVKETLNKIADYSNDEKQKAVNVYKFSLMTIFFIGFIIVLLEFALLVDFRYIIAESLPLLIGGCTCIIMTIKKRLMGYFLKEENHSCKRCCYKFYYHFSRFNFLLYYAFKQSRRFKAFNYNFIMLFCSNFFSRFCCSQVLSYIKQE